MNTLYNSAGRLYYNNEEETTWVKPGDYLVVSYSAPKFFAGLVEFDADNDYYLGGTECYINDGCVLYLHSRKSKADGDKNEEWNTIYVADIFKGLDEMQIAGKVQNLIAREDKIV